jgi:hypothetical protein
MNTAYSPALIELPKNIPTSKENASPSPIRFFHYISCKKLTPAKKQGLITF